jgi:hypothetical protein
MRSISSLRGATCPAICFGISVLVGSGTQAEEHWSEEQLRLYAVSLKCPAENLQVLELTSQNILGDVQHTTVRYLDGVPALITVTGRLKGWRADKVYADIDIRTETDHDRKQYAKSVASQANSLKAICEGPPGKRSEYFATLKDGNSGYSMVSRSRKRFSMRIVRAQSNSPIKYGQPSKILRLVHRYVQR